MSRKSDRFRKRVLSAAREIFKKYGYSKATMADIAKAINKGKSRIYYYFKSKEDIFASLIEESAQKIQDELIQIVHSKGDTKTLLKRYILKRMEFSHQIAEFYNQVPNEHMEIYNLIQKYRKSFDEFEILAIKNILMRGIENDEIRFTVDEIEPVAYGIVSAIKGLEIPFFVENKYTYFKERLNSMLNLLFYGLLKQKPEDKQDKNEESK